VASLFVAELEFGDWRDVIRRLSECGSLTFGERHIVVVVVKSPREDEALKFYITFG